MEQNYIEKQVKNQIQLIVRETNSEVNYSALRFQSKLKLSGIFIIPNKGKGPPGQTRSPGYFPEHPPDEVATPDRVSNPVRGKGHIFNSIQFFKTINSNFLSQLNFLIMKKQFLFLMMFILVSVVSITNSFGQLTAPATCPVPRTIDVTCLPNDALHPMPGTAYNYVVDIPTPAGTKAYTWFVTQEPKFIDAGVLTTTRELVGGLHIAASGTGYNDAATGSATLSLTWKSFVPAPALPVFVVIYATNADPAPGGCTIDNMKVFKIEPINAFTLDIANVGPAGGAPAAYETSIDRCIHNVVSATYDATAPEGVLYDFGIDYLYFVVTAANFSTSWLPSLQVTAIDPKETVTAVEWFRTTDNAFATPEAMPLAAGAYTATNPVTVLDPSGTVGVGGECIVIRVTIDHTNGTNQYQGLTDETVTVAVDGKTQLALTTPLGDIHFSSTVGTAADCGKEDGFRNDVATQILKARPDITAPTMPAPGLLPVKP